MHILNSWVVQQNSILQTGVCVSQSSRTLSYACSTARIQQDISAVSFCRCKLLWRGDEQWRTKKIFMGAFQLAVCGGHLYLVYAICDVTIWSHIHFSKPTFWRSLLIYSSTRTRTPLIVCVIALNINYWRYKLRYRRKINSTLRHSSS